MTCVKFYKTILSSDGHPFRVLQRTVSVDKATCGQDVAQTAWGVFERLEMVPDWRLHADTYEVEPNGEHRGA